MARFRLLPDEQQARSPLLLLWREFARQHSAMSGLVLFMLFFLLAVLSPLLTPHDPYLQNDTLLLIAPHGLNRGWCNIRLVPMIWAVICSPAC